MYQTVYIGSKWCDSLPEHGLSPPIHNIVGSFNSSGLGTCQHFPFDEYYYQNNKPGDEALLNLCAENKPDFIIMNSFDGKAEKNKNGSFEGKGYLWLNPDAMTLVEIKKMNIPIVSIHWDTVWEANIELAEFLLDYVNFSIILDSIIPLYITNRPSRYLFLWTPQDSTLYYNEKDRDIPISFLGRYNKPINAEGGTTGRKATIEALKECGIDIFHSGGQREESALSIEDYASYIRRSKIGLSLPKSHSGLSQFTGRSLEITLSGSMLLEELNLETLRFFTPFVDYIPYSGFSDLYYKARYYMQNDEERIKIAQNGYNTAIKHYNNTSFWTEVINKLKEENVL